MRRKESVPAAGRREGIDAFPFFCHSTMPERGGKDAGATVVAACAEPGGRDSSATSACAPSRNTYELSRLDI